MISARHHSICSETCSKGYGNAFRYGLTCYIIDDITAAESVETISYRHRCNVMTLHQRRYDVSKL